MRSENVARSPADHAVLVLADEVMIALVVLGVEDSAGQIEQIARTFGVDWPHFMAQIISFCIVCALLYRFAYRPVLAMLQERRRRIEVGLAGKRGQ